MPEARPSNPSVEARRNQADETGVRNGPLSHFLLGGRWLPHWNARKPEPSGLLTLTEAAELLGVDYKVIYALANAGLIDALQRGGKGRVYYSEAQLLRVTNSYLFVAA
jgi:excisionase family DNA binding protein